MLTATEIYNQLKEQADKFGFSTLSKEERFFLKRYKAQNSAGALTTSERVGKKRPKTWSGAAPSGAPKRSNRRRTGRARVWVDKSVATWKAPKEIEKEGIAPSDLLKGVPSIYEKHAKKQRICA